MTTSRWLLATILVIVAAGCSETPSPSPAAVDWDALTQSVTRQYTARWLGGDTLTGSTGLWKGIQSGGTIAQSDTDRFCSTINVQGADNAIGKVVAAALAEVASVRRHVDPAAVEQAVSLIAKFTLATCSRWLPGLVDLVGNHPTPTLAPTWPPAGYELANFDANYAGRSPAITLGCSPSTTCWDIEIVSRRPCLRGMLAMANVRDLQGQVIDSTSDFEFPPATGAPYQMHFEVDRLLAYPGPVTSVSCL